MMPPDGKVLKIILTLIFAGFAFGQTPSSSSGGASVLFLKTGLSARVSGLGEAFTALADDENALYYNPGGLFKLSSNVITLNHTQWFEDIKFDNLTFAYKIHQRFGMGVGISHMWMPSIQGKDELGRDTEALSVSATIVQLGFGSEVYNSVYLGATAKYFVNNLASYQAAGVAFDIGAFVYTYIPNLSFGMAIQNLGSGVKYLEESQNIPRTYRLGVAYQLREKGLNFSLDGVKSLDSDMALYFGAEYSPSDYFSLRSGNRFVADDLFNPSFGIGLHPGTQYIVNYTYYSDSDLGGTHRIGFSFKISPARSYSEFTGRVSRQQEPTPSLIPPRNVRVELENETLRIRWKAERGVNYHVYACFSQNMKWKRITSEPLKQNHLELKKPRIPGTYYFKITATRDEVESPFSDEVRFHVE
ncbi:MAG: hypothetical protein Kow0042_15440 [Calditrichia bacterium]